MITPAPTARISLFGLCAVCLAGAVLVSLTLPELAEAALKNAAGGGGRGGGVRDPDPLSRPAGQLPDPGRRRGRRCSA